MFKLKIIALSIGCIGLLVGCKSLEQHRPKAGLVRPITKVQHAGSEAQAKYELGRYYYGQRRHEEARRALEEALALDAAHSRASNVLGVIYASQGRYEEAQAQFKRALERDPQAGHLHSNIGYAYLLRGLNQEALASFEEALRLEPQSEKAIANLKVARERLGLGAEAPALASAATVTAQEGLAQSAFAQPSSGTETAKIRMVEIAPNVYELAMPHQSAPPSGVASLPVPSQNAKLAEVSGTKASSRVVEVAPNVFELGMPNLAGPLLVAMPNALSDRPSKPARLGVEVANGNGVTGMARRVATELKSQGIGVTRVSNRKPFDQIRTEIEYRKGFLTSAREIGVRLQNPPSFVESGSLGAGISVRLVLGRDLSKNVVLVDPKTSDAIRLALLP